MNHWEKLITEINSGSTTDPDRRDLLRPQAFKDPQEIVKGTPFLKNYIGPRTWYHLFQKKESAKS